MPGPIWLTLPNPEITPGNTADIAAVECQRAVIDNIPKIPPLVPPLPSCKVPAPMVVPPCRCCRQ